MCYNLWVMWVLSRYFKDFVLVRQHYLSKGESGLRLTNGHSWQQATAAATSGAL